MGWKFSESASDCSLAGLPPEVLIEREFRLDLHVGRGLPSDGECV